MALDKDMICESCGADFGGYENDPDIYAGAPCPDTDWCPSHWEERGIPHPDYPEFAHCAHGGLPA